MEIKEPLDAAHVEAILECAEHGHDFSPWENVKFITGTERQCKRCRMNQCDLGNGMRESYAIGSSWPPASIANEILERRAMSS